MRLRHATRYSIRSRPQAVGVGCPRCHNSTQTGGLVNINDGARNATAAATTQWRQYVDGAANGVANVTLQQQPHATSCSSSRLQLQWADGHVSCFALPWLRDHAPQDYHPTTQQRQVDTVAIPKGAAIGVKHTSIEGT